MDLTGDQKTNKELKLVSIDFMKLINQKSVKRTYQNLKLKYCFYFN